MNEEIQEAARAASTLIEDFGKSIGIEDVAFDEENRCDFIFDEMPLSIFFDTYSGQMSLETPVLEIPSSPHKDFYAGVLEDNFDSFANGLGCLALFRKTGQVVWMDRRTITDMDQAAFQSWLNRSLDRAEYWAKELAVRANSAGPSSEPAEPAAANDEMVFRA